MNLVAILTLRELNLRFRGAWLGRLWWLGQPVVNVFLYTFIFAGIMNMRLPGTDNSVSYALYLCSGIFLWSLLADVVGRGKTLLTDSAEFIKKTPVSLPLLALPTVIIALFNLALLLATLQAVMFFWQGWLLPIAAVLPSLLVLVLLAMGVALLLAQLYVFMRDVGPLVDIGLQLGFWATPIVYQAVQLPGWMQQALRFHPLVPVFSRAQAAFLGQPLPPLADLGFPLAIALIFWTLAALLYARLRVELLDEL
jgi:lipopolysaccharide transport system permease protein